MESGTTTKSRYRIGVDVGGTNTDSVVIDVTKAHETLSRGVVSSYKHATTPDVTEGIEAAVKKVMEDSGINLCREQVMSLTIGTTHFINAVVQTDSSKLGKVAVIRLAAPYTSECPSFIDFPENLKLIMNGHTAIIKGGLQIDGRMINELDEDEVIQQAKQIASKGINNIVLVGIYSPLDIDGKQEYRARDILLRELGSKVNIVCSRDVGQVGFLERENASILNASITSFAQRTIRGFKRAIQKLGLTCLLYLTQNDGTLITAAEAARLPIKTFSSGATNSMRGASYLAGIDLKKKEGTGKSIIVVDIGGTTTDAGMLLPSGFPRQAAAFIEVAGVRTNFRMPDVHSIGLGGGSRVRVGPNGRVTVGPDSVGHELLRESKVFGGYVLTSTDISVFSGTLDLGDRSLVHDFQESVVEGAHHAIKVLLEGVIDRMKTSSEDCDLLLVGGGSIIAPSTLKGVKQVILPPFHEVANAVGAAIASVSGEVDTIEILQGKSLPEALERIKAQAIENAVKMGADIDTTRIVDINVLPIQYVTNQATRIIVRAVGELGLSQTSHHANNMTQMMEIVEETADEVEAQSVYTRELDECKMIDYTAYRPTISGNEWILTETDLLFIMEGCGILGTGGGGSPYPSYLICRQILREGGSIRVVDHSALPDEGFAVRGGFMGSPSVGSERIRGGSHLELAGSELARYCGIKSFSAALCDEIGGGNGLQSLIMSTYYGIPTLDGDLMGRAYPKLNQVLPAVYDRENALVPCALCDGDSNVVLLTKVKNEHIVESIMRVVTTEMGSTAALCPPPLPISDARDFGVTRSLSQAWRLGRAVSICRQTNNLNNISDAILNLQNGVCLFVGKIVEVNREVRAGFTWGHVRIIPLLKEELEDALNEDTHISQPDTSMMIPFQNENLCAYLEKAGTTEVVASVPDLITILDSQSGSHLGTPEYTYGLGVTVIALAGHPLWRTEVGLKVGGPAAFGFNHPFRPIGDYIEPRSVIHEFISTNHAKI